MLSDIVVKKHIKTVKREAKDRTKWADLSKRRSQKQNNKSEICLQQQKTAKGFYIMTS